MRPVGRPGVWNQEKGIYEHLPPVTETHHKDTLHPNLPQPGFVHPPLPSDAQERKKVPLYSGVLAYFPDALAAVAEVSRIGNDQHNPGQPLHWAKDKSTDHADCIVRHLMERGQLDTDGGRHSAKVAWRALALLQTEIETEREMREDERAALEDEEEVWGPALLIDRPGSVEQVVAAALRRKAEALEDEVEAERKAAYIAAAPRPGELSPRTYHAGPPAPEAQLPVMDGPEHPEHGSS